MKDSTNNNTDELLELLGAAWDERLDDASFARLEELLASDEGQSREVLVAFSRLQVELAWLAASSKSHEKALTMLAPYFAESNAATAAKTVQTPAAEVPQPSFLGTTFSKRGFLALAAGILMPLAALTWYSLTASSPTTEVPGRGWLVRAPHKVAMLIRADGVVWQDGASPQLEDLLAEGERLHLIRGTAQLSMVNGADVLLQSPCDVELISENLVRLKTGMLTAQVARWGKGFAVEAEGLRVTDLGTRFAVLAKEGGIAEAHVLQGIVRAEPIDAPRDGKEASLLVKAGQAVQWNRRKKSLDSIVVKDRRFEQTLPQFRPLHPIEMANTGQGAATGNRDLHWRITGGHASGGRFPVQATVGRPAVEYLDNSPNQSQWVSVRGGMGRGVQQYTQYTFETTFDLTDFNPQTTCLVGQILADNRVQEIRLNGKSVGIVPWEHFYYEEFQKFHLVEIRDGFTAGRNRLEIDVINGASVTGETHNPMALRAEWQAFGCVAGS